MPSRSDLTISHFHTGQSESIFYHHRMILCLEEPVSISTFVRPSETSVLSALLTLNDNIFMFKLNFSGPCHWQYGSRSMTPSLQTCTQLYRMLFGILHADDCLYLILQVVWGSSFWKFLAVFNNSTIGHQQRGCRGDCQDNYVEGQTIIDAYFPEENQNLFKT